MKNKNIELVKNDECEDNKLSPTGKTYCRESKSLGYIPEEQQLFFILRDNVQDYSLGLIDLLKCLKIAEDYGSLPPMDERWWRSVDRRYELGYFQDKAGKT